LDCRCHLARAEYKELLAGLIKFTFDHVSEHVATEASVVSAIAQRADPGVKIDASIK
jgi:hypothetical protein